MNSKICFKFHKVIIVVFLFISCNNQEGTIDPEATGKISNETTTKYTPFDTSRSVTNISPNLYQTLADTLNIRVLQGIYKPGDSSIMHAHPDFALYVLEGGIVELTGQDGKKQNIEFKKNMTVVLPAETHSAKNIGNSTLSLIVVEVDRPRE